MADRNALIQLFPLKYTKGNHDYRLAPDDPNFVDTLKKVLVEVFKDFNFRTLVKTETGKGLNAKITSSGGTSKYLVDKLKDESTYFELVRAYFKGNVAEPFDDFHHKLCEGFLSAIRQEDGEEIYENLHYGKAQKIVNMMFKHLYCLPWDKDYEAKFKCCHMALDSFTLEWFRRCYRKYGDKQTSYPGITKGRVPEWSNLDYDEDENKEDNAYSYQFFVQCIREILKGECYPNGLKNPYQDFTSFQAEFMIWPDIQRTMATEAYILALPDSNYEGEEYADKTDKEIEYARKKDLAEISLCDLIKKAQDISAAFTARE